MENDLRETILKMWKSTDSSSRTWYFHLGFLEINLEISEAVLREQSSLNSKYFIGSEPVANYAFSHHMNFDIGYHAAWASEQYINKCTKQNVSWKIPIQIKKNQLLLHYNCLVVSIKIFMSWDFSHFILFTSKFGSLLKNFVENLYQKTPQYLPSF